MKWRRWLAFHQKNYHVEATGSTWRYGRSPWSCPDRVPDVRLLWELHSLEDGQESFSGVPVCPGGMHGRHVMEPTLWYRLCLCGAGVWNPFRPLKTRIIMEHWRRRIRNRPHRGTLFHSLIWYSSSSERSKWLQRLTVKETSGGFTCHSFSLASIIMVDFDVYVEWGNYA